MSVNDPIIRTREVCNLGRLTVSADILAWRLCAVAAVAAFAGLPIGKHEVQGSARVGKTTIARVAGKEMRCTPEKSESWLGYVIPYR